MHYPTPTHSPPPSLNHTGFDIERFREAFSTMTLAMDRLSHAMDRYEDVFSHTLNHFQFDPPHAA